MRRPVGSRARDSWDQGKRSTRHGWGVCFFVLSILVYMYACEKIFYQYDLAMPKDRKQYFRDYYSRNRDAKLRYQNDYYRKTKQFAKESLELLELLEPEIYAKKRKHYKDYQAAYRKKIREKRNKQE